MITQFEDFEPYLPSKASRSTSAGSTLPSSPESPNPAGTGRRRPALAAGCPMPPAKAPAGYTRR